MVTRNQVSRADLPRYGSPTLFEAESTPENVFLREFIMQGPKASIDMQYAENWQYLSGTVDTVEAACPFC